MVAGPEERSGGGSSRGARHGAALRLGRRVPAGSPFVLGMACFALMAACGGGPEGTEADRPVVASAGAGPSGAGGAGADSGVTDPRIFWEDLEGQILSECGGCHLAEGAANAPFLTANPEVYDTVIRWPGFVTSPPEQSKLLNYPSLDQHPKAMTASLREQVLEWLRQEELYQEGRGLDGEDAVKETTPQAISADGTLVVFQLSQFDQLDSDFGGASITFTAEEIPVSNGTAMLRIEDLRLYPSDNQQIHIVHPLFVVYPPEGDVRPDSLDNFSTIDNVYPDPLTGSNTVGTGSLFLLNWEPGSRLSIAFRTLELHANNGANNVPCRSPEAFLAATMPDPQNPGTTIHPLQLCARKCHDGTGDGSAVFDDYPTRARAKVDLSQLTAGGSNWDQACSEARSRITPGEPSKSQLVLSPAPTTSQGHPYRFEGNQNHYNQFTAAIASWINAEEE